MIEYMKAPVFELRGREYYVGLQMQKNVVRVSTQGP
jgi:hypothetical protein